ncbi:5-oxoprolinase subunit PxpA [Balneatrix alpica]|uniref:5-oxoprolinase subunit PxpA n=1 Tax=Balneatrix alpica TaxID=75684 RepID=UPI0027386654|nr:5-oxoprolinase subunit PxpA [Balneatrix alpica]
MWLNCDLGESFGNWQMGCDAEVMPFIDQANIACGFHASDPLTMQQTVRLALQHGVMLGAHPGYPDLVGFGRRSLACSHAELVALIRYQVGALQAIAAAEGGQVRYVKPHGALYNDMMAKPEVFRAVLEAVAGLPGELHLLAMAVPDHARFQQLADELGVPLWWEAFADRAYTPEGRLQPRNQAGAVYHDSSRILQQALDFASGQVKTTAGTWLSLPVQSLCVHGDNPESVAVVRGIRQVLKQGQNGAQG